MISVKYCIDDDYEYLGNKDSADLFNLKYAAKFDEILDLVTEQSQSTPIMKL